MEVSADDRLYIWHVFFYIAKCNNELAALETSPKIYFDFLWNLLLFHEYIVMNDIWNVPYWQTKGTYQKYPCLLCLVKNPAKKDK